MNMKKIFKYMALAAILPFFAASCVKDIQEEVSVSEDTVTLTLHSSDTKTYLSEDTHVLWDENDEIAINGIFYKVNVDEDNPAIAYVSGVQKADVYGAGYWASYYETDDEAFFCVFQQYQAGRKNTFSQYANISVALSNTNDLFLYNIASVIKLGVTGDVGTELARVVVTGNNNEPVSGTFEITKSQVETLPEFSGLTPRGGLGTYINWVAEEEFPLSDVPQYVYVVVPPQTFENGITVTLYDTGGRMCVKSTSKSLTTNRSEITLMTDFAFTEAEALSVNDIEPGVTSISYNVTAQPNSSIRTLLVYKSMWDSYYEDENGDYYGEDELLAAAILNSYGSTINIGESGYYGNNATTAFNRNGNSTNMTADTDYKLLVSYADGSMSVGKVIVNDIRTLPAEGIPPTIDLRVEKAAWNKIDLYIKTSEDVSSIMYFHYPKATYDTYVGQGMSDKEIVQHVGWELNSSIVDAAVSEAGYQEVVTMDPNYDWVILAMAVSSNGTTSIAKAEYNTYYVDPDATWTTVSTDAKIVGGFLWSFGYEDDIVNLTVEKMDGEDMFRILNLESAFANCLTDPNYFQFIVPETTSYFYIDARNHDAVIIEYQTCPMQLTYYLPDGYNIVNFCSVLSVQPDSDYPLGTYSTEEGMITFGTLGMVSNDGTVYGVGDCVLYL